VRERVLTRFPHFYKKLEEGKTLLGPGRFHELKYEDLMRDPILEMGRLYERLQLGGFEELQPRLSEYLAQNANYETNKFQLTTEQADEITERWGPVIRQYGYPLEGTAAEDSSAANVLRFKSRPSAALPITKSKTA